MQKTTLYPNWRDEVVYSPDGPQPQMLMANDEVKIIVGGLEPGQKIPEHKEATAMYHFLLAVGPGATVVMPEGTSRGMEAETRLAFLAARIAG